MTALDDDISTRLAALDQRYTAGRREIVKVLAKAQRPVTVPELVARADRGALPQSSAYRNLTVLVDAGVVHRLPATDEFARYELAEDIAGHHHHVTCVVCGTVSDVPSSPRLERALAESARIAAEETGFDVTGHHLELQGACQRCR